MASRCKCRTSCERRAISNWSLKIQMGRLNNQTTKIHLLKIISILFARLAELYRQHRLKPPPQSPERVELQTHSNQYRGVNLLFFRPQFTQTKVVPETLRIFQSRKSCNWITKPKLASKIKKGEESLLWLVHFPRGRNTLKWSTPCSKYLSWITNRHSRSTQKKSTQVSLWRRSFHDRRVTHQSALYVAWTAE